MLVLDLRAIVLQTSVSAGIMCVVLYAAQRSFPATIRGLGDWAAGTLCVMLTSVLGALRGDWPDVVTIVGGNALALLALCLGRHGTQKFYGLTPSWRTSATIVGGGSALIAIFLLLYPDYTLRLAIMTAAIGLLLASQLVIVLRHGERHASTALFGGALLTLILIVAARGLSILLQSRVESYYTPTPLQTLYLGAYNAMSLLLTLAFMLLATHRLRVELERQSNSDPLTGALNRRAVAHAYRKELALAGPTPRPLSLLLIDFDHFKAINDRFGHAAGDRVLLAFTRTAQAALRAGDHFARLGGEEFVALLPDTPPHEAMNVANRLRRAIAEAGAAEAPPYTISIGVASHGHDGESLDALLHRADIALYRAKHAGRDRAVLAPDPD